jgi:hypothetical protein
MNSSLDVSICIVNYNSGRFVNNCLKSIFKWTQGINYEIVIVDNCSTDGSLDLIRSDYPMVRIVENKKNEGFAKATNLAVRASCGEYLLLLNPDTELRNNAIGISLQTIRQYGEKDVATCKILTPDEKIGVSRKGLRFFSLWAQLYLQFRLYKIFPRAHIYQEALLRDEDFVEQRKLYFIAGCFLLIRRDFYVELGMLDERYFLYGEDDDLCVKIRKAGGCIHYLPDGEITHWEKGSSRPSSLIPYYFYLTNRFQFYKLNRGFFHAIIFRFIVLLSSLLKTITFISPFRKTKVSNWDKTLNNYSFLWALGLKKEPNV